MYSHMRNFINQIFVTFVFFAFTVYFANNPLSELSYVHLKCSAVGSHHEVYQKLL